MVDLVLLHVCFNIYSAFIEQELLIQIYLLMTFSDLISSIKKNEENKQVQRTVYDEDMLYNTF